MRLFVFLNKWDSLILSGFKDKMAGHQNSLQIKQKCLKKQRVFIKPIIFIQLTASSPFLPFLSTCSASPLQPSN